MIVLTSRAVHLRSRLIEARWVARTGPAGAGLWGVFRCSDGMVWRKLARLPGRLAGLIDIERHLWNKTLGRLFVISIHWQTFLQRNPVGELPAASDFQTNAVLLLARLETVILPPRHETLSWDLLGSLRCVGWERSKHFWQRQPLCAGRLSALSKNRRYSDGCPKFCSPLFRTVGWIIFDRAERRPNSKRWRWPRAGVTPFTNQRTWRDPSNPKERVRAGGNMFPIRAK